MLVSSVKQKSSSASEQTGHLCLLTISIMMPFNGIAHSFNSVWGHTSLDMVPEHLENF